ncbi:MAG: 2-C-methyl-D-erythritol 2,4-cyclodiphosphate synthase [Candidatus Nealsonbacteria bacterium]|nr:2-C-methyl-D-erythritol 2,4-cyclodiphosphate synthase [Candidatus Nealsonbacteria bacterium]
MRVGIGHDTHRLQPGGPLRLGGIDVAHDKSTVGHSDGDVLLHAIVDALLGAVAAGDIGQMFPDSVPANRGRDSAEMLAAARDAIESLGWRIGNLDCIVHAERPKLLPHRQTIRKRIAEILDVDPDRVSLKGKTGEKIGPVGREEIIVAQCVAMLEPK